MRRFIHVVVLLWAGLAGAVAAGEAAAATDKAAVTPAAEVGKPAPDFTLTDLDGKAVKLAGFRGKTVVLEWYNPECPFVRYAHGKGPLKDMGNVESGKGVVWLAVNSGAVGREGAGKDKNVELRKEYGINYPVLLDESGAVGKTYGARTTPHMYVIDPAGNVVYKGGLDNAPLGRLEDGATMTNYVSQALADLAAGRPVATAETAPYGCSVKYAK